MMIIFCKTHELHVKIASEISGRFVEQKAHA